jgi:hypothetical protein
MSHLRRPESSESWMSAKNTFLHDSGMVHNSVINLLSNSSGLRQAWSKVEKMLEKCKALVISQSGKLPCAVQV